MKGGFIVAKEMKFKLKGPVESLDSDETEDDGFSEDASDNPNALVTFSFASDSSLLLNELE